MRRAILCLTLVISLMCCASGQGFAQSAPQIPDGNGLTILVRTTIIALNHANRTGNYTVFRDLGSSDFQKANTAAKLAGLFAKLRRQDVDLGPVVLFNPQCMNQPAIDKQGRFRLTCYFTTTPLRVNFDLAYQWIENRWRLFGISFQTEQAPAVTKKP